MRPYPIAFTVDYPERLSKTSTGFRLLLVLPILAIAALIGGYTDSLDFLFRWQLAAGGYLTLPTALMILFRMKYPRWWFDWNLQLWKLSSRVGIYLCLATDKYPSIDEEQSVHVAADYPDVSRDLNRWRPLVKWFLAIPHYVALLVLWSAAFFAVVLAWFSILLTGVYPRSLFDYVVGVSRWSFRVGGYAFLMLTDIYPPFRLSA